jgi:phosphatidylethanolamine-binding protein (PEBP) family uncharacterized protein
MIKQFGCACLAAGGIIALLAGVTDAVEAASAPFMVTSSSFSDGGMLTKKNAADDPMRMCGGENVSPALPGLTHRPRPRVSWCSCSIPTDFWVKAVSHWVGYGIPGDVKGFAEGELTKETKKFVGGKGTRDNALYIGPCPPVGDTPHHYVFTVVATDLEPAALKAGMTRDQVYAALSGHSLVGSSIVGKYAR